MKFVVQYQNARCGFGPMKVLDLEATTKKEAYEEADLIKHRPGGYSIQYLYPCTPNT